MQHACRDWIRDLNLSGAVIVAPAIVDYRNKSGIGPRGEQPGYFGSIVLSGI